MYDWSPVDSNNIIKPGLNWQIEIRVPQHLEAKRVAVVLMLRGIAIQAGHEPVECVKHGRRSISCRYAKPRHKYYRWMSPRSSDAREE